VSCHFYVCKLDIGIEYYIMKLLTNALGLYLPVDGLLVVEVSTLVGISTLAALILLSVVSVGAQSTLDSIFFMV
jgi:hypothetical protein